MSRWRWRFENQNNDPVQDPCDQPQDGFDSRAEAEAWIGEMWPDLVEAGVDQVRLFQDDQEVHPVMSLHPAE